MNPHRPPLLLRCCKGRGHFWLFWIWKKIYYSTTSPVKTDKWLLWWWAFVRRMWNWCLSNWQFAVLLLYADRHIVVFKHLKASPVGEIFLQYLSEKVWFVTGLSHAVRYTVYDITMTKKMYRHSQPWQPIAVIERILHRNGSLACMCIFYRSHVPRLPQDPERSWNFEHRKK